jgi:hypothetical protein
MLKFLRRSAFGFGLVALIVAGRPAVAALPQVALENAFPALPLDRPVWLTEVPDGSGRVVVVEQRGKATILAKTSDGAGATEFLNIEDRNPQVDNEEGFLSLCFHPQFKTNGLFYIYYNQQKPRRSVISEFKVSATDSNKANLTSERVLLQVPQPYGNHKGGQVSFGPDGYLYLGLGDGGAANDPHDNGQNMATLLAKISRIDVNSRATMKQGRQQKELEYGIPKDNPFVGETEKYGVGVKSGLPACAIRGASVGIAKPATCGSATSARMSGKKWISSSKAAITAGPCARDFIISNPVRRAPSSLIPSSNTRTAPRCNQRRNSPITPSA